MVETISADEYEEELDDHAGWLIEAAEGNYPENPERGLLEAAHDVLDAHQWFFQRRYGPAAHGCIIEHADGNPEDYLDLQAHIEADDPREIIKRLAYAMFEADVVDEARSRLD